MIRPEIEFRRRRIRVPALDRAASTERHSALNGADPDAFRAKVTTAGTNTYEAWRESAHDDLVLAPSLPGTPNVRDAENERNFRYRLLRPLVSIIVDEKLKSLDAAIGKNPIELIGPGSALLKSRERYIGMPTLLTPSCQETWRVPRPALMIGRPVPR